MKVSSYIWLLSSASLGGAFLVGILGWWLFHSTNDLAQELNEESKNSGKSAGEYSDIKDFLELSRGIVVSLELYPDNYEGIFGVTWDRLTTAKKGLNDISEKYLENYPQSILEPIAKGLNALNDAIRKMEKVSIWNDPKTADRFKASNQAKKQFEEARRDLIRVLIF